MIYEFLAFGFVLRSLARFVTMPIALARGSFRLAASAGTAISLLNRDALPCPGGCGRHVNLVTRTRCGRCGFVQDGFVFSRCKVCGDLAPYVSCACGASLRNPLHRVESRRR